MSAEAFFGQPDGAPDYHDNGMHDDGIVIEPQGDRQEAAMYGQAPAEGPNQSVHFGGRPPVVQAKSPPGSITTPLLPTPARAAVHNNNYSGQPFLGVSHGPGSGNTNRSVSSADAELVKNANGDRGSLDDRIESLFPASFLAQQASPPPRPRKRSPQKSSEPPGQNARMRRIPSTPPKQNQQDQKEWRNH